MAESNVWHARHSSFAPWQIIAKYKTVGYTVRRNAWQCRPLANVHKLTQILIDVRFTQLSLVNCKLADGISPNFYTIPRRYVAKPAWSIQPFIYSGSINRVTALIAWG